MHIQLRDLRYFEVVAELGHLGKAADQLGRTQPALTKAVGRLEDAFECALFERKGRRIRLTAVGEVLLTRARMLRSATEEALREVNDFVKGNAGHVRIGSGPIAAEHLLPEICNLLLEEAPRTMIEITVAQSLSLREQLRDGRLDLLIGLIPENDDAFVSQPIAQDVVVVTASRNHPVFDLPCVTMKSLLAWGWVLPTRSIPSRQWLDSAFQLRGLAPPSVQIEANSIPLLQRLVAKTELLSFVSRHTLAASASLAPLREVLLEETTLARQLGVTYRREGYLSPATQRLVALLQTRGERLLKAARVDE